MLVSVETVKYTRVTFNASPTKHNNKVNKQRVEYYKNGKMYIPITQKLSEN